MFSGWECATCQCPNESPFATCRRCIKQRSLTLVCNSCGVVGQWFLPNNFQLLQPRCGKCKAEIPVANVLPIGKEIEEVSSRHSIIGSRSSDTSHPMPQYKWEEKKHTCMLAAAALGNEKFPWETARWDLLCHLPEDGGNIIHVLAACGHAGLLGRLMLMNELRFSELMDSPNFKGECPLDIMRSIKRMKVNVWAAYGQGKPEHETTLYQRERESFADFDRRSRNAVDDMRQKVASAKTKFIIDTNKTQPALKELELTVDSSTSTYETTCSAAVCEVLISAEALTVKLRQLKKVRRKVAFLSCLVNRQSPACTDFAANSLFYPQVLPLILRNLDVDSYFLG